MTTITIIDADCPTCGGEGAVDGWGEGLEIVCPACVLRSRGVDPYAGLGSAGGSATRKGAGVTVTGASSPPASSERAS